MAEARPRSGAVEESGRRGDRGCPPQARRFPGRPPLSAARRDPRRTDRRVAAGAIFELRRLLPDRSVAGQGRAGARAELSRQRRIRRSVPIAERAQPRHRRCLGRLVGDRSSRRHRPGRSRSRWRDGLEPGRLHLGVSHHEARRPLQGRLGRRRHLELDDVLRQYRHPSVHAAVPRRRRPGTIRRSMRTRRR